MGRWLVVAGLILNGCVIVKPVKENKALNRTAVPLAIVVMTNAQQTAAIVQLQFENEELKRQIDTLKMSRVYLSGGFVVDQNGNVTLNSTAYLDTIRPKTRGQNVVFATDTLLVRQPPIDTLITAPD